MKKILLGLALAFSLTLTGPAMAEDAPFVKPVSEVFTGNGELFGGDSGLPDYSGADEFSRIENGATDSEHAGAYQIRNIMTTVIGFVEKMMVPVAILLLLWGALSLLIERGNEEKFKMRINQVIWTGAGFLLFVMMFNLVDFAFFGVQGDIFQDDNFAQMGGVAATELLGLINFITSFAVGIAVAFLVFGAIQLIIVGENEEAQGKIRKQIVFSIIGILLIVLAGTLSKIFFGVGDGANIEVNSALLISQMVYWLNILLGFIGLGAVISIIWAGVQMIIHFGNEEMVNKSKKIIMFAVIGLVLAFSAFTITRFFLTPGVFGDNQPSAASQLNQFDRINP